MSLALLSHWEEKKNPKPFCKGWLWWWCWSPGLKWCQCQEQQTRDAVPAPSGVEAGELPNPASPHWVQSSDLESFCLCRRAPSPSWQQHVGDGITRQHSRWKSRWCWWASGSWGTRWDCYHVNNETANPTVLSISLEDESSLWSSPWPTKVWQHRPREAVDASFVLLLLRCSHWFVWAFPHCPCPGKPSRMYSVGIQSWCGSGLKQKGCCGIWVLGSELVLLVWSWGSAECVQRQQDLYLICRIQVTLQFSDFGKNLLS